MAKIITFTSPLHCLGLLLHSLFDMASNFALILYFVQFFVIILFHLRDFAVIFTLSYHCFRSKFKGPGQFNGSAGVNETRPSTPNLITGSQPFKSFLSQYELIGLHRLGFNYSSTKDSVAVEISEGVFSSVAAAFNALERT